MFIFNLFQPGLMQIIYSWSDTDPNPDPQYHSKSQRGVKKLVLLRSNKGSLEVVTPSGIMKLLIFIVHLTTRSRTWWWKNNNRLYITRIFQSKAIRIDLMLFPRCYIFWMYKSNLQNRNSKSCFFKYHLKDDT